MSIEINVKKNCNKKMRLTENYITNFCDSDLRLQWNIRYRQQKKISLPRHLAILSIFFTVFYCLINHLERLAVLCIKINGCGFVSGFVNIKKYQFNS